MNLPMMPKVIWVVGDNTNVGKTTISAALIRMINRLGKPAVGFKPYAGARLLDVIDLLEEIATGDGYLVGRDARMLVNASPLANSGLLEVTNPSWRLSHTAREISVFIRKGSVAIDQRSCMHTENAKVFWARPDLVNLNKIIQLPFERSRVIENREADILDFANQEVQMASFMRLAALSPDFVVCEGAGRLLPVWKGAPPVQHVLLISGGDLYLFRNVGIDVSNADENFGPFTIKDIAKLFQHRYYLAAPIPLIRRACLDDEMDVFITKFANACVV